MGNYIELFNAFSFGILISLTIRWARLLFAAYKLKANQKGPLDRMIEISSDEIMNGVIRKRLKQTKVIRETTNLYEVDNKDGMPKEKPMISSQKISSIYNSFKNKKLSIYLIPNEDIHIAIKKNLLTDLSKYYLNDEINDIIIDSKMKEYEMEKQKEDKKKALFEEQQRKIEEQKRLLELQRKQKEKEIEDSINI